MQRFLVQNMHKETKREKENGDQQLEIARLGNRRHTFRATIKHLNIQAGCNCWWWVKKENWKNFGFWGSNKEGHFERVNEQWSRQSHECSCWNNRSQKNNCVVFFKRRVQLWVAKALAMWESIRRASIEKEEWTKQKAQRVLTLLRGCSEAFGWVNR